MKKNKQIANFKIFIVKKLKNYLMKPLKKIMKKNWNKSHIQKKHII